ncbi:Spexin, partial [Heterocephalus glaber]
GLRGLSATTLALLLVFSALGDSRRAPQRPLERRNWTPQAMLYLKGAQRRSPNPQLLPLPEAAALLLALLQKPQEDREEKFDSSRFREDILLTW